METPPTTYEAEAPVAAANESERIRLRGWALASVLAALMLTLLLAALDQTIVGTALPIIISELHGFDRYTWVVTAYLLTSTTMIPIVGKLSDQFGRKWFVVGGVIVFLIGSALSGASQTMIQLILFRGLQGLGAGMLQAMVFTLVGDIFTPAERARWQGLFAGVFALASVIGPSAGGWITDNTSWRWVFYVNLPIGILALLALVIWLPANISIRSTRYTGRAAFRRIDFAGALIAAGATTALLLGLTWGGQTYPWTSPLVLGTLAGAAALYIAFVVVERFAVEPILPLNMFRNRIFAAGSLLSLSVGAALFAVVIYLPLFIQGVLGQSATSSGAAITPLTITMAAGAIIGGLVVSRIGRYQWLAILGSIVMTGGIFLLTRLSVSTGIWTVTRDMIVVGAGLGMIQPVLTLAVQNAIPRQHLGVGTGAVTYLRSLGSTLGLAVVGSVVNNTISTEIAHHLPPAARQFPPQVLSLATSTQVLVNPAARRQLIAAVEHAAVQRAVPPAVAQAVAKVPPGPNHDAIASQVAAQVAAQVTAQVMHQVIALLDQLFAITREALAIGIQHGFQVAFGISIAVVLFTLFLRDVPLRGRASEAAPAVSVGASLRVADENMAGGAGRGEPVPGVAGSPQAQRSPQALVSREGDRRRAAAPDLRDSVGRDEPVGGSTAGE